MILPGIIPSSIDSGAWCFFKQRGHHDCTDDRLTDLVAQSGCHLSLLKMSEDSRNQRGFAQEGSATERRPY